MIQWFLFWLLSIVLISCNNNPIEYKSENFNLIELADGVYTCIHKIGGKAICNAGIIDNGKETIIFDTFLSPTVAEELVEVVDYLKLSPIKFIINSHYHNDHIRGNQVFGKDVKIISTKITEGLIAEWEPKQLEYEKDFAPERFAHYDSLLTHYRGDSTDAEFTDIQMWRPYYEILANSSTEVTTRLPNVFVEKHKNLDGPDRSVLLETKGKGHTDSDLIIYLPDDKIVFTGDLVFNECHPYLGHGFPNEWKNYLTYIESLDVKHLVPGHGDIASTTEIGTMKNYITDLEEIAREMIKAEKTAKDVGQIEIPEKYKHWLFDRFFEYNLSFLFNEKIKLNTK